MAPAVTDAELVLAARAELAEGPVWDDRRQELVWVDIHRGHVHLWDPAGGREHRLDVGQPVGVAVPCADGGLAVAARDGFGLLDIASGRLRLVAAVEADRPTNRMNDGACDVAGRLWAGTMSLDERAGAGALYRLDPDYRVTRALDGLTIPNGIDWSPDGTTMYLVDSPTRRVWGFDFEASSGSLDAREVVIQLEPHAGLPDGMTVDAEGCLWVALWGGSAVRCYEPDGALRAVVAVPTALVTSCAFGGPDLADLYITTARRDAGRGDRAAGSVFRARPGARGRPPHRFAGGTPSVEGAESVS